MKNIQKSIRISDDINEIVMKQPGQNFSEKFENLVRKFAYSEREIDVRISRKQQELDLITRRVSDNFHIINDLDSIRNSVEILLKKCNTI